MKRKKHIVIIVIIVIIMIILFTVCISLFQGKNENYTLTLEIFKQGEEYRLSEIKWNMSPKEVERALHASLLDDPRRSMSPNSITYYMSEKQYMLEENTSNLYFEFQSDKLKVVQLYFYMDENSDLWFDNVVEKLIQLYGTATEQFENSNEHFSNRGYRWDAKNTSLQIISMAGDETHPQIVISIGILEPQ